MRRLFFAIMVLSILFSSFVFSHECGDFVCEAGEDASCPPDCTPGDAGVPVTAGVPATAGVPGDIVAGVSDSSDNALSEVEGSSFFSSNMFKIVVVLLILIILGAIGFILYRRKDDDNKTVVENQSQVQSENVARETPVSV